MALKYAIEAAEAVVIHQLTSTTTGGLLTTAQVQARLLNAQEQIVSGSEITLVHDALRPGTYYGVIPPLALTRNARYWLEILVDQDGVRLARDRVELVAGYPSPVIL